MATTPFVFQQAIKVSGGDLKKPITIPEGLFETCEGSTYVNLGKKGSFVESLLLGGTDDDNKSRRLAKTDVLEKLFDARVAMVKTLVGTAGDGGDDDDVAGLIARDDTHPKPARLSMAQRMELPETFVIRAPRIGDVSAVDMRVRAHSDKRTPLFMELTSNNVAYLRAACKHQYVNESIKNPSTRQKKRKLCDNGADGDQDVDGNHVDASIEDTDPSSNCDVGSESDAEKDPGVQQDAPESSPPPTTQTDSSVTGKKQTSLRNFWK
jgi:hypothetical protein